MLTNKLLCTILVYSFNLSILAVKCEEGQFRTFAGEQIDITEAPYAVIVTDSCTGALVSPKWVLSAAHCFVGVDFENATVDLGTTDKRDSYMNIRIEKVYVHPGYLNNTSDELGASHDIALVKLATPALLSETIQILEIEEIEWPMRGKRQCTLVGFGRNIDNDMKLHISRFPVTHGCDCIKDKEIICTKILKDGDDSPCFGDAGSVLVCDNKGVAVTSHALPALYCDTPRPVEISTVIGCGMKDTYFLFSYIQPHLEWYHELVPRESPARFSKASNHTMKSILCYDLIANLHLFALFIIFSPYFINKKKK